MNKVILIKYGELTTKKSNRKFFINTLYNNVNNKLKGFDVKISKDRARMLIEFNDEDFANLINQKEEPELNFFGKVWNFIKNYWYFVVIPIVVISIFYIVLIVIYKKKGSRE